MAASWSWFTRRSAAACFQSTVYRKPRANRRMRSQRKSACYSLLVPQISTWLTVLGEHGSLSELSVVSITECDLQTCAASWRLLSRWRAYLDVILSTPLMKLQGQRDDDFDDELYDYLDEAEHLGMIWQQRCRGGESGAAGGAIPTEAAALAQRRLKKVGRAGAFLAAATPAAAKGAAASPSPAPVGALTDSEDEAPQPEEEGAVLVDGWSSKESSTLSRASTQRRWGRVVRA